MKYVLLCIGTVVVLMRNWSFFDSGAIISKFFYLLLFAGLLVTNVSLYEEIYEDMTEPANTDLETEMDLETVETEF